MRIILLFSIIILVGIGYSFIYNKFFQNKILLFLPTILGVLWFIYIFTLYTPKPNEGFGDLAIVIYAMMVFAIMVGNVLFSLYLIYKSKKNH